MLYVSFFRNTDFACLIHSVHWNCCEGLKVLMYEHNDCQDAHLSKHFYRAKLAALQTEADYWSLIGFLCFPCHWSYCLTEDERAGGQHLPLSLSLCPLSSPSHHLSLFYSLERGNPDFKNELLPISLHLLPPFPSSLSLCLSLSYFIPSFCWQKQNQSWKVKIASSSPPLYSQLDKGIYGHSLFLLSFLESCCITLPFILNFLFGVWVFLFFSGAFPLL